MEQTIQRQDHEAPGTALKDFEEETPFLDLAENRLQDAWEYLFFRKREEGFKEFGWFANYLADSLASGEITASRFRELVREGLKKVYPNNP